MKAGSHTASPPQSATGGPTASIAIVGGGLGVVFGDIGTSPIYTVQTLFSPSDSSAWPCSP
ncbi:Low affinity potassium transport system protein kup [Mycobacterium innocens]|uniref:Low affinity potassium transport system protein kup n=1 Tax=Mycobacterium innocens TaxID=2341083 RepID=A0A498QIV0_9MYCO|nr:Low affinity potassium transport system protein kup [Mycobacterium innocens]